MSLFAPHRLKVAENGPQTDADCRVLSRADFLNIVHAFEAVFGLTCFRETKHFRDAPSIEPAYFIAIDQYHALVHMIDTVNESGEAVEINSLRKLMVRYLSSLNQVITVKLLSRQLFFIAPKVWLDEGLTH